MKLIRIVAFVALIGFSMASCENQMPENNGTSGPNDDFVPVTNINGVNTSVPVGTVSLGGRVVPSNATYKTIKWSLQPGGDIEATIRGNNLTTTEDGFVKVMATVENGLGEGVPYTKPFTIWVDPFVAVTRIFFDVPNYGKVGEEIYLEATVYPEDASYTDIVWSVYDPGTARPTIKEDVLTAKAAGRVIVTATIKNGGAGGTDYTENFSIYIIE